MKEKDASLEDDAGPGLRGLIRSLIRKRASLNNGSDLTDEIHDLMDEGKARGLITGEESDMFYGVLDLKETTAHSIMVPRTEISAVPSAATLDEVIRLVNECGHTRIPLYDGTVDRIVGILHAKDLLRLWGQPPDTRIPSNILRPPFFVPGTKPVMNLLRNLQEKQTHLAIVADEYGGTAGIITIEDILEEIVGEIMDEHDNEESLISAIDTNSAMVDARLEIEKLEKHFGMELPEGDFESVGGFIIHLLGKIPEKDEKITFANLEMTIHSADERKIYKIKVTRSEPAEAPFADA
jgi:magnesium and cobalt transporter